MGVMAYAMQPTDNARVIEDIIAYVLEHDENADVEQIEEDLWTLAANPKDINTITEADLQALRFLSPEQIDAILLHVYRSPLHSLYELQLIPRLKRYEVRNLTAFVYVAPYAVVNDQSPQSHAGNRIRHEIISRLDGRNLQQSGDKFYTYLKYRCTSEHFSGGVTMDHDVGEPWQQGFDFYSAYFQMQDIGVINNLMVGDYHASFGSGLVVNTMRSFGSKHDQLKGQRVKEGFRRYTSTSETDFLRGTATSIALPLRGKQAIHISASVSSRAIDGRVNNGSFPTILETGYHVTESELAARHAVRQHTAIGNITWKHRLGTLGFTTLYTHLSDTLKPKPTYYNANYFHGDEQISLGVNYYLHWQRWTCWGEIATASNGRWGIGNLTAIRFAPTSDVALTSVWRYYSPTFDNIFANGWGESSRNNDEIGMWVGVAATGFANTRWQAWGDVWRKQFASYGARQPGYGWEMGIEMQHEAYSMTDDKIRLRAKQEVNERVTIKLDGRKSFEIGNWEAGRLESRIIGSIAITQQAGYALGQDIEWEMEHIGLVIQGRAVGFYAPKWENRIYLYENDVLYASNSPALYGIGGRFYLNIRYKVCDWLSLYVKASHTQYAPQWVTEQELGHTGRTDIHGLVRLRF